MAGDAGAVVAAVVVLLAGDTKEAAVGTPAFVPSAGYEAVGGAKSAPEDPTGTAAEGGIAAADGGVAADAIRVEVASLCAAAIVVGVVCVDGNAGAAVRATIDVSSGVLSFFHQAKRGPDWQPTSTAAVSKVTLVRKALNFMASSSR